MRVGGQLAQPADGVVHPRRAGGPAVVADDGPAVVLDTPHQLFELEQDEPAVDAELDDVALDLLGDATNHLGPLEHRDHVADGDEVLDLQRRQGAADCVQPVLVALQGLQGLIGPADQSGDRVQWMLLVVAVHGDDRHVLRDRDDRHVDRPGHPLGGSVPGPGLRGRHVGVGDEVDVGPGDAPGVRRQDDRPVHLGQLRQALRAELGVEQEAPRADVEHFRAVADDDQRAHVGLQDAVEAFPERAARSDRGQRLDHGRVGPRKHACIVLGRPRPGPGVRPGSVRGRQP